MSHFEALESRQFLSAAPVSISHAPVAAHPAIVKKAVSKPSFVGTYFGSTTDDRNDDGDSAVVLVISNQTKKSLYLRFNIFGQHYAGTFTGSVVPGKQFDVKRKVHGGTMDFKGYISTDGFEFKGRIKSNYYVFNGETKISLERV